MEIPSYKKSFFLLLLLCCVTILPFIGLSEYHTKGEPRESVVSYSMLSTGDWTLPRNNGGEMAYKPPFFHWCVAVVSAVRGEVTEGTSRLPSSLALIGMTMMVFSFFARRKGVAMGLLTTLVALTTFELHRAGANCRVDMVLSAATVCAMLCLYQWHEKGRHWGPALAAVVLMGIGTLTKGPVGTLIPCLVMGVYMLVRGERFLPTLLRLMGLGLLSLIPYAAWFFAAWQHGGQEFLDLMYEENIGRMTNTMGYNSCVEPWYYNFLTLVGGFAPWTLLLLLSLPFLRRPSGGFSPKNWLRQGWSKMRNGDAVAVFAVTVIVVIFIFYSIPQSKRSVYLMPIYPFMAYFFARYIGWIGRHANRALHIHGSILAVLILLVVVATVLLRTGVITEPLMALIGKKPKDAAIIEALSSRYAWWQILLIVAAIVLAIRWWFVRKKGVGHAIAMTFVLTIMVYVLQDGVYGPRVLNTKSVKAIAAEIDRAAPASEAPLYEMIEAGVMAKGDPVHFFEVNFYLGNRIGNFYKERPEKGFLLISADDASRWLEVFRKEGYDFTLRYSAPKREMRVFAFEKK